MSQITKEDLFMKALLILGVPNKTAEELTDKIGTISVFDIQSISELLITPSKDDHIFPMRRIASADIFKVCSIGAARTTLKSVILHEGILTESPTGSRCDTDLLRYKCLWIPNDDLDITVRTLHRCKEFASALQLKRVDQDAVWWRTFLVANLAQAYRHADKWGYMP